MTRRKLWQKPKIRTDEDEQRHRKVSWLELFFDLFFVVVIAQLSHNLSHDISLTGIKQFILLFIPTWWVWIGFTFYNERFETEGLENRLFTFLLMIPTAGLAIFAHNGIGENYRGFALSYALARSIITFLWIRAGVHEKIFRPVAVRYVTGFSLSIILVSTSIFVAAPIHFMMFGLALICDLLAPAISIKPMKQLPRFSISKLPERYGLFTIIVLGETIVAVIQGVANKHHFSFITGFVGILGLALAFALWWIYFDFIGRRPFKLKLIWTLLWSYLHMPLVMGYVLIGVGVLNIILHDGLIISNEIKLLITLSVAFSLIIIGLLETTLRREFNEPTHPFFSPFIKIIAGLVALSIGLLVEKISALALLGIMFSLLLIQMLYGLYVWFTQEVVE